MYVLRAPRSGPFLITREALPDVIASLRAESAFCSVLSAAFVSLGAGLILLGALDAAAAWWQERQE